MSGEDKSTKVCLSFDFDAISLWLNMGLSTPTPVSRGEYGARVGVPRILELLDRHDVPATFFVPGHTIDTYPEIVAEIYRCGHEIAAHGYLHETPVGMSLEQEIATFDKAERAIERITGNRPLGYRSPSWDLSSNTIAILEQRGYLYDSSLMSDDFRPFPARLADSFEVEGKIGWGRTSSVIELPVAWELDDFPHFAFLPKPMGGLRNPRDVFEIWRAEFDYCHQKTHDGVFTLTMHPQIIGRGPRVTLLGEFIAQLRQQGKGVTFARMADVARSRTPAGAE